MFGSKFFTFRVILFQTLIPKIMATHPAGASNRQLIHFSQLYLSGKFRRYDYGYLGNLKNYGQQNPPDYDTQNIEANTYIYYGENDYLSDPEDVLRIANEIQNLCLYHKVPSSKWNHMDYLWSTDVKKYINDPITNYLLEFDNSFTRICGSFQSFHSRSDTSKFLELFSNNV